MLLLVFHCNCLYLVLFLRYSASNNGVPLKSGLGVNVVKVALFDRSYMTCYWSAIVNMALSCNTFELFDVEE